MITPYWSLGLTRLKELRKRKGGRFLRIKNVALFLHWTWAIDLEFSEFSLTTASPDRDSCACGVSALLIGVQPCMGPTWKVLWLSWALGVWSCPCLSLTLEGEMLEGSWLSPDWHRYFLNLAPYIWYHILWSSYFATSLMAFMWIACWQRFGIPSAQEDVIPGPYYPQTRMKS